MVNSALYVGFETFYHLTDFHCYMLLYTFCSNPLGLVWAYFFAGCWR